MEDKECSGCDAKIPVTKVTIERSDGAKQEFDFVEGEFLLVGNIVVNGTVGTEAINHTANPQTAVWLIKFLEAMLLTPLWNTLLHRQAEVAAKKKASGIIVPSLVPNPKGKMN